MSNDTVIDATQKNNLCIAAVKEYFVNTDEGNYTVLIDYFTDDAVFNFLGQTFTGRKEIKAFVERDRGEDVLFHHVTDTTITIDSDGTLRGRTQLLVHFDRWEVDKDGNKVNSRGVMSGLYHDQFVIEGNRAKVASRTMEPRVITIV